MSDQVAAQDWQKEPGRLFLLANFIGPHSVDTLALPSSIEEQLGEDPVVVADQLLKAGVLEFVDPNEPPERMTRRITVRELQALLAARGLTVSGRKQELVHRLTRADPDALHRALLRKTPLQCTEEGKQIAIEYLAGEGESLVSKLDLPDEWWLKFLGRVPEWHAAGVLGNAVDDALTQPEQDVQAGIPASERKQVSLRTARLPIEPELVLIPAGSFLMGTSDRQIRELKAGFEWARHASFRAEQPQHEIHLTTYEIGRYPVTNAQYAAFIQATDHDAPDKWPGGRIPSERADHPVGVVTWHDAHAYVAWLRDSTGQPYRLPTEAEWEKAARGTDGRIWPWGDHAPDQELCNFNSLGRGTTPVGSYSPQGDSPYGCADMAGNMQDWCSTAYENYAYADDDGREELAGDSARVIRGGGSWSGHGGVRCAYRDYHNPDRRNISVGFRVALGPHS